MVFRYMVAFMCGAILGCSTNTKDESKMIPTGVGIVMSNRDTTISPGDDFFRYVNGGWIASHAIPDDRGSWNAFSELSDRNNTILRRILLDAAESREYPEGTDQRKVADLFRIGMDSLLAEKEGLIPANPLLQKAADISDKVGVQNFLIEDDEMGGDAFFKFSVSPDKKNSLKMAVYLGSGGIGLPERDYYFKADGKSIETRDRYRQHVVRMLSISGWDEVRARKSADRILLIETELARATVTKEDSRNPVLLYNKMATRELAGLLPSINWTAYFTAMGVEEDSVIVSEPAFLKGCERILNLFSIADIKDYLRWSVLRKAAPFLHHVLADESFQFQTKYLLGAGKRLPRWKRVLGVSDQYMGEAIGKMYVAAVFPPEAKAKALAMVENIRFAFADRIKQLDWMSDSTKKKALEKLSRISVKIGYPDKWKSYVGLVIEKEAAKSSFYGNILNAARYQVKEKIKLLKQPVDKSVWGMSPQTVNASYNPQFNEITFPAGILQPPFYDYRADEAVNYGGIGAGIGHEISHAFDDEGSRYDPDGNLKNWWSANDFASFNAKGKALVEQFNSYQPLPGIFVQGQFTLGENIGDLGGLNAAFDGYNRYLRESGANPAGIEGMSPYQRFFMSWATIWRVKYRDEALRTQILTNEHAPGMYRTNGPLSNMSEFYKAFGLKKGDKMYKEERDRLRIW